ncbi:MAG TPA: hypothetical protein VFH95_15130 [Candidatus Kapabacteria bacterium]|nr:hypothetical protein [Candidatus Kapabacteria bacterium]
MMNKVQSKHSTSRIVRKTAGKEKQVHKEISDRELTQLAKTSHAHDWLRDSDQDIYSLQDGKPARWPSKHTNGAV